MSNHSGVQCKNCFNYYEDAPSVVCPHCGFEPGAPIGEVFYLYPGTMLNNRYAIGQVLGFGGFGITYKAWDTKLETVVAVKEYYPSGIVNRTPGSRKVVLFAGNRAKEFEHGLERFVDEAKNMAKFGSHRNIVNVFEYFEENETVYIVMEFLDGITLSAFLQSNKIPQETGIEITLAVGTALRDIHASGIIHRDVSPDNIFICHNGNIKLIDFGAARFVAAEEEKLLTIILKPGFAPPEQYEKINAQGPWTDIYALGATFYYMVTGIKPEESTNRKIEDCLVPPKEINPEITEELNNTILKAMAIDKHLRFQNISELEAAIYGKKKVMPLVVEVKRRKQIRFASVAAALVVVLIGGALFGYNYNREREAETLEDAALQFWYVEEADGGTYKEDAYGGVIQVWSEKYDNVTIELVKIPGDEYAGKVKDAIDDGQTPMIFEADEFDEDDLSGALDLSKAISDDTKSGCLYLKSNKEKKRLPLGFVAPVVFVNTELVETSADSIGDLQGSGSTRSDFFDGTGGMFETDTSDYFEVQAALPGRYRLLRVEKKDATATLTHYISAANCDKEETTAALRFLDFLYSDNAQDYLFLRNRSESLPLNKNTLNEYTVVYDEFEGFFENAESYKFTNK